MANVIGPAIVGMDASDQAALDARMIDLDGTPTKAKLGANAILGVSLAAARAAALAHELPLYRYVGGANARTLPVPLMNILNGGAHADSNVDVQEFMVVPLGAPTFAEALRYGAEIFHALKKVLKGKGASTGVGDEGGYAPSLASNEEALAVIMEAMQAAGLKAGKQVALRPRRAPRRVLRQEDRQVHAQGGGQDLRRRRARRLLRRALRRSTRSSPSRTAAPRTTGRAGSCSPSELGGKLQLVGDDLFVTNVERLARGIAEGVANSILVKVNQIGSLTETLEAVRMAHRAGYTSVMSHRSGETEDTTIADLAVACDCGQIKTGSASRTDRIAKYNQLLRIEEELGKTRALRRARRLPALRCAQPRARTPRRKAEFVRGPAVDTVACARSLSPRADACGRLGREATGSAQRHADAPRPARGRHRGDGARRGARAARARARPRRGRPRADGHPRERQPPRARADRASASRRPARSTRTSATARSPSDTHGRAREAPRSASSTAPTR